MSDWNLGHTMLVLIGFAWGMPVGYIARGWRP